MPGFFCFVLGVYNTHTTQILEWQPNQLVLLRYETVLMIVSGEGRGGATSKRRMKCGMEQREKVISPHMCKVTA